MIKHYRGLSTLFTGIIIFTATQSLQGAVADITGDAGSAQTGSVTLSGGTSGAVFDSTTSTITQKLNFISMPNTSATNGQILIDNVSALHFYVFDGAPKNVVLIRYQ